MRQKKWSGGSARSGLPRFLRNSSKGLFPIVIFFKKLPSRYGAPGQVESMYAEFATHFLNHLGIPCVETMLKLLDNKRNGIYVSNRVRNVFSLIEIK